MGLVILNVVLMCAPFAGMSAGYAQLLEVASNVVTLLFVVEMGVKIGGSSWKEYWADSWNRLDAIIVYISLGEILMSLFFSHLLNITFLRALRLLRVVRMLRLMKSWKGLYKIVMTLVKALPQMSNVVILMVIIIIVFALVGKEMVRRW